MLLPHIILKINHSFIETSGTYIFSLNEKERKELFDLYLIKEGNFIYYINRNGKKVVIDKKIDKIKAITAYQKIKKVAKSKIEIRNKKIKKLLDTQN